MRLSERVYERAMWALVWGAERLPWRAGKIVRAVEARKGLVDRIGAWARAHRDPRRPLLWMHASSVGEGLQAKAVLERLRERQPDLQIFYTYHSPSAEAWAAGLGVDGADCIPFDRWADMARTLAALRPRAIVFCKYDVWPVLTRLAHVLGIPVGLVSAVVASDSKRLRPPARWLLREAYARLDRVGAVAQPDAERLVRLGVRPDRVRVTGDARIDQAWARAQAVDRAGALLASLVDPRRVTLVAGSTWREDEARLVPAFHSVRGASPDFRLVLVPHEPERPHVEALEASFRGSGARLERHSTLGRSDWDVLVVDRVGILAELYGAGELAYVGGAFGTRGIHSVLEPAALGLPVIFGPRHEAAREAAELVAAGGAFVVRDRDALIAVLRRLAAEREARRRAGAAARRYVESHLGGVERNAELVAELLSR